MDEMRKARIEELREKMVNAPDPYTAMEALEELVREVAPDLSAEDRAEVELWLRPVRGMVRFLRRIDVATAGVHAEWKAAPDDE
jgi:hypothetical protein